jgi:hypothetical protein
VKSPAFVLSDVLAVGCLVVCYRSSSGVVIGEDERSGSFQGRPTAVRIGQPARLV